MKAKNIAKKFKSITKTFINKTFRNIQNSLIKSYTSHLIKNGLTGIDPANGEHMKIIENIYNFMIAYRNKTKSYTKNVNFDINVLSKLSEVRLFDLFNSGLVLPINYNPIIGMIGKNAYEIAHIRGLENDDKHYVIFVDDAFDMLSKETQNFVIAHEIAHFIYGDTVVGKRDNVSDDVREIRADVLAATDCIKYGIDPLVCFDEMINTAKRHPIYGSFKDNEKTVFINNSRRQALEEFCASIKE